MSNERIDLDKYASMPIGGVFGVTFDQLFKDVIRHEGGGVTTQPLNLSLAQMEAIKDLPNLIAELKRCYKLLDDADYAMSRYGFEEHQDIDNVADAYEAVTCALAGLGRYC